MTTSAAGHPGDVGANRVGSVSSSASGGALPALGGSELPLLDSAVLRDMEEQLGRPDIAWNFANDYAGMWVERQRCLVDSVEREDRMAALDAVISLKVSSAMVGGLRLARLAEALEATLRRGDLRDGASVLAMISLHGHATVKELRQRYLR
ncbi:Hpt domain-containing protein [Arthrobacter pascens]|uniref:Hpt domain-containing protein n=1 Tax=Arthrobacter pascens TaxID=1677 RepID=UPI0027D82F15|nr:Hpt domain-containing protein [Arthrobacter pascens]